MALWRNIRIASRSQNQCAINEVEDSQPMFSFFIRDQMINSKFFFA